MVDSKFCEELDCLVLASQDSNIYVWGFETSGIDALCEMRFVFFNSAFYHFQQKLLRTGNFWPNIYLNKIF